MNAIQAALEAITRERNEACAEIERLRAELAAERERCAKIAEQEAKGWEASAAGVAAFTIAAAIRGPLPGPLDEVFPAPANKGVRMGVDNDNA